MNTYKSTVGTSVEIPVVFDGVTGLTLATLDSVIAFDGLTAVDLADDLSASFVEVDSSEAPGLYLLTLTTLRAGSLYVKMVEGILEPVEFAVQSEMPIVLTTTDPSLEGDYTITVSNGATTIPGATVRVYDAGGSVLVTRGISDSLGQITFALPVGTYKVRFNKDGYDFSAVNPTTITVLPNSGTTPRLDEILPATGYIGDPITIIGEFFDSDNTEVVFGAESTVPVSFIDGDQKVGLLMVPSGITAVAVPVKVRKPNPSLSGQYLYSNIFTFVRL